MEDYYKTMFFLSIGCSQKMIIVFPEDSHVCFGFLSKF
uniref:Uncharacterized protein n=1 Tax=Populus trichocarpa TaxID=3694 RepID=A9P8Z3_POPTR|nr:unknown [Populus trichocarpa]